MTSPGGSAATPFPLLPQQGPLSRGALGSWPQDSVLDQVVR